MSDQSDIEQGVRWWIDRAVVVERERDSLRAQLASATERGDQYYEQIICLEDQLAIARKALEAVWFDQKNIGNCAPDTLDLVKAALSDEEGNSK
jgi:hypothetical protein